MSNVTDNEVDTMLALLGKDQAESIGLILAGIAAAVVSIVYSCRHLKTSKCCGFSCTQEVVDTPQVVVCPPAEKLHLPPTVTEV